jgi:hypothetical protein
MTLSRTTRRQLLKAGLGAASLGLIDKLGLPLLSPRTARANTGYGAGSGKPTKLLTIYVPGGWSSYYMWCSLTASEISKFMKPFWHLPGNANSQWVFYDPEHVTNTDGSGDELGNDGYQKLRVPRVWDEEALLANQGSINFLRTFGWAWANPDWKVWEKCNVVHGIHTESAAHGSAMIGMLTGTTGATFTNPSIHARVAYAMAAAYGDDRPLGSMNIGPTLVLPQAGNLPSTAAPTSVSSLAGLEPLLSETGPHWKGLHNRNQHPEFDYWGQSLGLSIPTNSIDEDLLGHTRSLAGSSDDLLFEQIYDGYRGISRQLAADILSQIDNSPGLSSVEPAYWNHSAAMPHFSTFYSYNPAVQEYADLTLKLLSSDTCSAIHLAWGDINHDNHGYSSHVLQFTDMRQTFEQIGRFLAYMNMIPGAEGGTLLDETLVMIGSEFSRNWPKSGFCDHWPVDSVCFAGGNVHGNRMIGGFDMEVGMGVKADEIEKSHGFLGKKIDLIDENGAPMTRQPLRKDIVHSALDIMGIPDTFLPGGPGKILGLKKGA